MSENTIKTDILASSYLSVDCGAIRRNLIALRHMTRSRMMAVIKHDGYGLSLVEYARLLVGLGITELAVGSYEEALALRRSGIGASVLLLTPQVSAEAAGELLRQDIMLTVGSMMQVKAVRRAAEATGLQPQVHIKIDTGLGRYGFQPNELKNVGRAVSGMAVQGIYTHFSSPYASEKITRRQYETFLRAADQLEKRGVHARALHCCASGGLLNYPEMHMDIVRTGSALVGRVPNAAAYGLVPAATLVAPVTAVKPLSPGLRIGYRGTVCLKRNMRVGILSVGYGCTLPPAHKLPNPFRAKQYAVVNGSRAEVLGPLGIGALAIDITGIPCKEGDLAELEINPLLCSAGMQKVYLYEDENNAAEGEQPLPPQEDCAAL